MIVATFSTRPQVGASKHSHPVLRRLGGVGYGAGIVKLVASFRRPADAQSWMGHFLTQHEPLMHAVPGLQRLELASPFDTMALPGRDVDRRGAPFLVAELYFADRTGFEQAMGSAPGRAMLEDLQVFAGDEVSLYLADVEREHVPPGGGS
ncbi:MAG: EthD family reductase [Solirubrobacteraceae bacterium]|nr:EthD family reductase [Solirubrobacteraceae bacterium]